MKLLSTVLVLACCCSGPLLARAETVSPLGKVLQLIDSLKGKIISEGETAEKAYHEYAQWCEDSAKNTQFAIEDGTKQKTELTAKIDKLKSDSEVAEAKIAELAGAIATADGELKEATGIREKELAEFSASEKELIEGIDSLDRAIGILEKELAKGGQAALAQVDTSTVQSTVRTLAVVLDAAALSSADHQKLQALLQQREQAEEDADDEQEPGAPSAAAYSAKSGGIVDLLEDMKEKADAQLSDLRKAEVLSKSNYELLKQSLDDRIAADNKDMESQKSTKASSEEQKASAEGELEATAADLLQSQQELEALHAGCLTVAADHEGSIKAREEELKAIAEAEKILKEVADPAASFLQVGRAANSAALKTRVTLAKKIVSLVKRLAKQNHSAALAQLASRIAAVAKFGSSGHEDPFTKIKGLIQELIAKLEKEAKDEATEKAYCDREMSATEAKKAERDESVAQLTAKIDQATSKTAQLKEEVKVLEGELAALATEQAEADKIRQDEHAVYVAEKAELEAALAAVRKALGVLRDYYASKSEAALIQDGGKFGAFMQQPTPPEKHQKAEGAGGGIIGLLEVCESDFATNLAKIETEEADAQSEYDKITQENTLTKTSKDKDLTYKGQEIKGLDKDVAELSADLSQVNTELAAVNEYYQKLAERCVAKPEAYEEREKRRTAEIEGLKTALATLENEGAFLQSHRRAGRRSMRGSAALAAE